MEPLNIQRLVKQNKQYAEASQHARSITKGSIVSEWHEKHDMRGHTPGAGDCLSCREQTANADVAASMGRIGLVAKASSSRSTSSSCSTTGRGAAKQELEHAKQALLQGRQQRLEQLYRQEQLQHEMELQGLGLALLKQQH